MENKKIFFDGEGTIAGRLASVIAKEALNGREVVVFNSEKILIIGNKKNIIQSFLIKKRRGGQIQKGPFYPSEPERIFKRIIRGMLPYKKQRGKIALKRIKCYVGENVKEKIENPVKMLKKEGIGKGISLRELSGLLKGGIKNE